MFRGLEFRASKCLGFRGLGVQSLGLQSVEGLGFWCLEVRTAKCLGVGVWGLRA